ncbi:MAG: sulfotransferase [Chloroflexota bacterium]|nr:sulfotransferase [Chloroflexota bacterium]
MRQFRLRKLRRRLGLYQPAAPPSKPMDPASIRQRRKVFETLPDQPECPEGWRTGAPDFVIFGAQKSGTTWWFRLIEQHPGVVQPKNQRPELHFFDRLWAEPLTDEHIERYHRYFPRPEGRMIGEKTPEYLSCVWAPPMVKAAAPDARAIVLLRDPVDRYVSGLSHMSRAGLVDEPDEPDAQDEEGLVRVFGDRLRVVTDAIERGMYATQVEWLLQSYPAERLLVMQYEACAADAPAQLARTFEFLGLPPHELSAEELARPRNKAKLEKEPVPDEHIEVLRRYYRPEVERLRDLVPDFDPLLWPHFRDLA